VDLCLNGPVGSGIGINRFSANNPSEAAVAQACQSTETPYRFIISLTSLIGQCQGATCSLNSGDLGMPAVPPSSIIKMNGERHAFFCSRGGNTGTSNGNGWDAIRYTHSTDGFTWATPVLKLTASACPSQTLSTLTSDKV
jgi:hypothetical protein